MKRLLLILLLSPFALQATNYYFSAAGNDSNDGLTTSTPWKTITKFNSIFTSRVGGDSILFRRGDSFYGQLYMNKAGSLGNPIIIGAYGSGADPIITGLTAVTSWRCIGVNIWESTSAVSTLSTLNMVIINGVNVPMGRYPNTGYLQYKLPTTTTKTVDALPSSTRNWAGATAVMRLHHWVTDNNLITSHSGNIITHTTTPNATSYPGIQNYGLFIQNDARTLDALTEWYYSPSTKKIRIYSSGMPQNVQVATIDTLVKMPQGKGYVTFDNITFKGSNESHFTIASCPSVVIQNCQFDFAGKNAIWGGKNFGSPFSPGFVLKNSSINHTNNNGIYLASEFTGALIQNNTIDNTGLQPGMGKGGDEQYMTIRIYANDPIIEYNTIDSSGYIAINFKGNNAQVRYNFITHYNMTKMDGGGIYTYTGSPGTPHTNARIHHNIVLNSYPSTAGTSQSIGLSHGIYLDNNTANTQVDSNTVANTSYSTLFLNVSATSNNIFGNTFYNGEVTQFRQTRATSNTFTDNIFFAKAATSDVHWVTTNLSAASYFSTMGTFTNNYYAKPINDFTGGTPFFVQSVTSGSTVFAHWNLATWQTQTGKDAGSVKSPSGVTSVNDIRFEYNETGSNKVVSLTGTWKDAKNVTYTTSVTIPPYSSWIGIKQ